ncbi:hypothetical protein QAD02_020755 [Eretmocerus hayati]|uniref:Uncharacterized protein n=1 Tax=Eretmocerus hayati TaxID=131215 RepID=A0ACC2PNJ9_9HYME|nr:hypothetical protein QAD02_020755 [Eretmocerus hayati]
MGEDGHDDGEADIELDDEHGLGVDTEDNSGSIDDAVTPDDDESLSSPGGFSGLSSLASPLLVLPSPSSISSPCPLTPPVTLPQSQSNHPQQLQPIPHRNPVGTNPHDVNNPLSVNQLTGQCIKTESSPQPPNPTISVT